MAVVAQWPRSHREKSLYEKLKAGPAGGRLQRPTSAGSTGRCEGFSAARYIPLTLDTLRLL
jgi:hypothetical protein